MHPHAEMRNALPGICVAAYTGEARLLPASAAIPVWEAERVKGDATGHGRLRGRKRTGTPNSRLAFMPPAQKHLHILLRLRYKPPLDGNAGTTGTAGLGRKREEGKPS